MYFWEWEIVGNGPLGKLDDLYRIPGKSMAGIPSQCLEDPGAELFPQGCGIPAGTGPDRGSRRALIVDRAPRRTLYDSSLSLPRADLPHTRKIISYIENLLAMLDRLPNKEYHHPRD